MVWVGDTFILLPVLPCRSRLGSSQRSIVGDFQPKRWWGWQDVFFSIAKMVGNPLGWETLKNQHHIHPMYIYIYSGSFLHPLSKGSFGVHFFWWTSQKKTCDGWIPWDEDVCEHLRDCGWIFIGNCYNYQPCRLGRPPQMVGKFWKGNCPQIAPRLRSGFRNSCSNLPRHFLGGIFSTYLDF